MEEHEVFFGEVVDEEVMKERLGEVLFAFGLYGIHVFPLLHILLRC